MQTHTYTHMQTHAHIHTQTHIETNAHKYTQTYTQKDTHMHCAGLNKNGPCLSIKSGPITRNDLIGVGVALLEEMYHWALA